MFARRAPAAQVRVLFVQLNVLSPRGCPLNFLFHIGFGGPGRGPSERIIWISFSLEFQQGRLLLLEGGARDIAKSSTFIKISSLDASPLCGASFGADCSFFSLPGAPEATSLSMEACALFSLGGSTFRSGCVEAARLNSHQRKGTNE